MLQSEAAKMLSEQGRHFDWLVKSDLLFGSPQRAGLLDALASCIAELLHDYELLALEHPINTSIDAAEGCMRLHGRIDLILKEKEGRGLIIIDYKTGSTIPKSIEVETVDNLQLPIYMLSMDSPSTPVAALMVCQIHHAHPVHTQLVACNSEYSAKDFNKKGRPFRWEAIEYSAEIRDQLLRLYRGIQAAEFQVENPSRHPRRLKAQSQTCKFCDFKSICQYPGRYD